MVNNVGESGPLYDAATKYFAWILANQVDHSKYYAFNDPNTGVAEIGWEKNDLGVAERLVHGSEVNSSKRWEQELKEMFDRGNFSCQLFWVLHEEMKSG